MQQRKRRWPLVCSILCIMCAAPVAAGTGDSGAQLQEPPAVCFVVRTYVGHDARHSVTSLPNLLRSLVAQTDPRWEARLLVMDAVPYLNLARLVAQQNDSRINIFAEWVGPAFKAKAADGTWELTYHKLLYNLSDTAIRMGCHRDSRWVTVTNGDNEYDAGFVAAVVAAPAGTDAVAVDYYSRYQRPTAEPCRRFEAAEGMPRCKRNEMRVCQVDLSAVAWSRERLIREAWRFGTIDTTGNGEGADGLMATFTVRQGWKVHYLEGRCLVHHSPTPQQCALRGDVWDDSGMEDAASFGGTCRTRDAMAKRISVSPHAYETLQLNASFDPGSFGLAGRDRLELTCVRRADREPRNADVFGRICAARQDFDTFPLDVPDHTWDVFLPPDMAESWQRRLSERNAVAA